MHKRDAEHTKAESAAGDEVAHDGYEPPTLEDLQHPDGPTGIPAGPGVTTVASPRTL